MIRVFLLLFTAVAPLSAQGKKPAALPGKFVDATEMRGIHFKHEASPTSKKYLLETMGSGVAAFDYDNDGRLDLFFANGAQIDENMAKEALPEKTSPKYWNRLYHQTSSGSFEDVTEKAGLKGVGYATGVAVGDYDNDGFEDLFVAGYGHNLLYHNNGDGTFTDVTQQAGVGGGGWSTSAAWVDLDRDGKLDLVVARYLDWHFDEPYCGEHKEGFRAYCHPDLFKPMKLLAYHNDGNGKFTEVSEKIGMNSPGKGLGVAFNDYDGDGWPDVFIANDSVPESLYHNKGDGTFEELAAPSQVGFDADGHTYAGMGVDFADYDNDGRPDLIVTNLANQKYALYRNMGDGNFDYATYSSELGMITLLHSGWGVKFIDYDNDGWKDLFIAQGHVLDTVERNYPNLRYKEAPLLLRNSGNGKFTDLSSQSGVPFARRWASRGLASGDFDNNGKISVVITTNDGPAYFLQNETDTKRHWITLRLRGTKSNRDGIGSIVKITTAFGSQVGTVSTAGSYESSSDRRMHFGLGASAEVANIEIRWPSGIVQLMEHVRADRVVDIVEPAANEHAR
jgi:enediyne biosynthesis protein E4